jgi:hypothetical protein
MKRLIHVAILAVAALAPLVAQTPKGWKMRVDRSTQRRTLTPPATSSS